MQFESFTYYIITTLGQTASTFTSQNHAAGVRILCILLFEPLCNLYEIPAGVLRGSGHALYPALSTMLGTCAFRIGWICTVFRANCTLPTLYHAFPLSWLLTILLWTAASWYCIAWTSSVARHCCKNKYAIRPI